MLAWPRRRPPATAVVRIVGEHCHLDRLDRRRRRDVVLARPRPLHRRHAQPHHLDLQILSLVASGLPSAASVRTGFAAPASSRTWPPANLFAGCLGCSLLGIYITFSPVAVCPLYSVMTHDSTGIMDLVREQWGLTHRMDQQVVAC